MRWSGQLTVTMGHRSSSLRRAKEEQFTQVRDVEAIIEHFGNFYLFSFGTLWSAWTLTPILAWNSGALKNDISLLKLKTPIDFSPGVQPIQLPRPTFRSDRDSPQRTDNFSQINGPVCLISGYGTIQFRGRPANMLQQATVPLVTRKGF